MNKIRISMQKYGSILLFLVLFLTVLSPIYVSANEFSNFSNNFSNKSSNKSSIESFNESMNDSSKESSESSDESLNESSKKVVRIGMFEDTYNVVNEDGEISGYGYEYIQKIAGYTGWTYEYVQADWSDCFEKLKNGEIDILNGISYTEERAENMLFSDIPMGQERYYIYADIANTDISFSDLNSFDGKRIGVLKDNMPEIVLNEWEKKNNLHSQHIGISSGEEVLNNLKNDKMDCFVSVEEHWDQENILPVINIGSSDIYYAINKDRLDLKEELDGAMRRITNDKPFYADELYNQYLSTPRVAILSKEERVWLKEHGPIRIGYLSDDPGISLTGFANSGQNKNKNVIDDYINYAKNCMTNQELSFETVGFDSIEAQLEGLKNGKIDLIFKVPMNPYYAEKNNLSLSDVVMSIPYIAVTTQGFLEENDERTVAIEKDNLEQKWYINYSYPSWKIVECDSVKEAEQMVRHGTADCLIARSGQLRKYMKSNKFHVFLLEKNEKISFGVNREEEKLLSILNKTLITMPSSMLTNALSMYDDSLKRVTVTDFINDNFWGVLITFTIIVVFISIILGLLRKSTLAETKAKEAMKLAESANNAKSNFLFNMSHDIRTPMNAILGFAELAEKKVDEPQMIKDYLHKIRVSGTGMMLILDKVLEFSRIESGKTILEESPQDCEKVLESCMIMMNPSIEKKHLQVTIEKHLQMPYVYLDEARMTEVVLNILSNAIKYTADGGKIHCTMRQFSHPTMADKIYLELSVADNGVGMSKEFQKRIFELFAREHSTTISGVPGTGLGMAITKKLVELMDGTIRVESQIGEGSTVSVRVPLRIASYEDTQPKKSSTFLAEKEQLHGKRILLAEDNDLNAEIAITLLEEEGLQIDRVADGVECVEKLDHSDPGYYALILMDIQMPDMNGYQATEKIRQLPDKRKADIPIIAMTANAFAEDKAKAISVGMNDHVAKPIDMNVLIEKILNYL